MQFEKLNVCLEQLGEKNTEKYLKTTSSLFRDETNLLIWSNFMGNGSINPSTTRRCFSPQIPRPVLPAVARRGVPFTQEAKIAGEFGKIQLQSQHLRYSLALACFLIPLYLCNAVHHHYYHQHPPLSLLCMFCYRAGSRIMRKGGLAPCRRVGACERQEESGASPRKTRK